MELPRPRPCDSCPYRRDVPSGIWSADEYAKLLLYDGLTAAQPTQPFQCHQGDGHACAGWLGYGDPYELLAVRLWFKPEAFDYTTDVPLFASGAEAAAHGLRDIDEPGAEARRMMDKLRRRQQAPSYSIDPPTRKRADPSDRDDDHHDDDDPVRGRQDA